MRARVICSPAASLWIYTLDIILPFKIMHLLTEKRFISCTHQQAWFLTETGTNCLLTFKPRYHGSDSEKASEEEKKKDDIVS